MTTIAPGASTKIEVARLNEVTDANGKPLKFEENKDSPGDFQAKGKDGNLYSYSTKNVLVDVAATAAVDNKELRKRMPGIPLPKAEAKKLDDEIKKEAEEAEKAAEAGVESPEVESFKKRSTAPEEAPPGRRAR